MVRAPGGSSSEGSWHSRARRRDSTVMANRCEVCGKGPTFGNNISHAHNVSSRRFNPNLQSVRALVNGAAKRLKVCTRCIRSGKVTKAA